MSIVCLKHFLTSQNENLTAEKFAMRPDGIIDYVRNSFRLEMFLNTLLRSEFSRAISKILHPSWEFFSNSHLIFLYSSEVGIFSIA